jgi:hypothetical protein
MCSNFTGDMNAVSCDCYVFSGRGLCNGLITRPEESYRLECVVVCDLETSSRIRRPWPVLGCSAMGEKNFPNIFNNNFVLISYIIHDQYITKWTYLQCSNVLFTKIIWRILQHKFYLGLSISLQIFSNSVLHIILSTFRDRKFCAQVHKNMSFIPFWRQGLRQLRI